MRLLLLLLLWLDKFLSGPGGQGKTGVISAGKHESVEQLLNRVYLSRLDVGRSASDAALKISHNHLLSVLVNTEPSAQLNY